MASKKKGAEAPETAQDAQDGLTMGTDTTEAQRPAEAAENARIIGPEDPAELLGCQDVDEAELEDGTLIEYVVTAEEGLRLREAPSLEASILAELPWGAGVFVDEPPIGEWLCVTTGLLSGYMLAKHLAPMASELKEAITYDG